MTPLLEWVRSASELLATSIQLATAQIERQERTLAWWVIRQLGAASHLTSESVLLVLASNRPWDAEALVRPVVEGTVKLAYIALGNEEREQRAHEFWHVGYDLAHFGDDRKLRTFFERVANADDPMWRSYREMLLTETERQRIATTYSKKQRDAIATRWSFRSMCDALGSSGHKLYGDLGNSAFSYALNSHVLHRDAFGVALLWDRQQRSDSQRGALELAHGARLISDVLAFAMARLTAITVDDREAGVVMRAWWSDAEELLKTMRRASDDFAREVYGQTPSVDAQ